MKFDYISPSLRVLARKILMEKVVELEFLCEDLHNTLQTSELRKKAELLEYATDLLDELHIIPEYQANKFRSQANKHIELARKRDLQICKIGR